MEEGMPPTTGAGDPLGDEDDDEGVDEDDDDLNNSKNSCELLTCNSSLSSMMRTDLASSIINF